MQIGDVVYTVSVNTANLDHQPDGVELWQGEIIKNPDMYDKHRKKDMFFQYKRRLYGVGKNPGYDDGNRGTRFHIPFTGRPVFDNLQEAKEEMIKQIFLKEEWL